MANYAWWFYSAIICGSSCWCGSENLRRMLHPWPPLEAGKMLWHIACDCDMRLILICFDAFYYWWQDFNFEPLLYLFAPGTEPAPLGRRLPWDLQVRLCLARSLWNHVILLKCLIGGLHQLISSCSLLRASEPVKALKLRPGCWSRDPTLKQAKSCDKRPVIVTCDWFCFIFDAFWYGFQDSNLDPPS